MSNKILPRDAARNIFQMKKTPDNVRLSRWIEKSYLTHLWRRLPERLGRWAFGWPPASAEGIFTYRRGNETREIVFNGRNAQFHALYEDYYQYGYEFETAVLLMRLAQGPGVFYDIGANWGYFSLLLAARPEFTGPIYAFEPHPATYGDLTRTIAQAGLKERVTALNYGLGRTEETLHIDQEDLFWTGTTRLSAGGSGVSVPVHTLDTIRLPAPAVIKLDAEGMETAILGGGEKMLRQHKPFLVFESYLNFDDPDQTWSPLVLLQKLGYQLFNPALGFRHGDQIVPLSYGDPLEKMLARDPAPATCLVPVTPANRFLMRNQINIFACHESRMGELIPPDFVRLPAL